MHPVTGPPGAGKTTALVSLDLEHLQLARFGVRDYGLELAEAGDPFGLAMRDALLRGELLPDDVVKRELLHFLRHLPDEVVVVTVEGYPRDLTQCADFVDAVRAGGGQLSELVVLDVPDDAVWARVPHRSICGLCGAPAPGDDPGRCSRCGGATVRRGDDSWERLGQRLEDYRKLSADVRSYFAERGLIHVLDGLAGVTEVRRALREVLRLPPGPPHPVSVAQLANGRPPAGRDGRCRTPHRT